MLLSDVVVGCCCRMLLSDVVVGCCCWMLLLDVVVGCCCWMLLLDVVVGCCCWMLLLDVVVGCCCCCSAVGLFCCLDSSFYRVHGSKWICSALEDYALPYYGTGPVPFCMSPVLAILSRPHPTYSLVIRNVLEMLNVAFWSNVKIYECGF
jgi:hypothetical protein